MPAAVADDKPLTPVGARRQVGKEVTVRMEVKAAGIADPAEHFQGTTIRAKGTVKEVDGVPRVEIDDARQIAVVE